MGILAYAGCTLIIAVVIHAVYTRSTAKTISVTKVGDRVRSDSQVKDTSQKSISRDEKELEGPTFSLTTSDHDGNANEDLTSVQEKPSIQDESSTESSKSDHNRDLETSNRRTQSVAATSPPKIEMSAQTREQSMPPPALSSPSRTMSPPRLKSATKSTLAPSLRTNTTGRTSSLMPPPSAMSSLRVPTQKKLSNTSMQPALAPTTSTLAPSKRPSRKVVLSPGHSPLDWAALTKSTAPEATIRLRGDSAFNRYGPQKLARITPSQLAAHTGRKGKDAWTSYGGKVYNISAYLKFHPGGEGQLLKGAGRSSDEMFAEVHPWVNWDGMLSGCLVGRLVDEDDVEARAETEAYERWVSEHGSLTNGTTIDINALDEMD